MKLPRIFQNWISILGTIIALIAFIAIVVLIFVTTYYNLGSIYFGLFTFIITPGFLVLGLLLISVGAVLSRKKYLTAKYPDIDLNDRKIRNATVIFIVVTTVFVLMTILGSYEAIVYSESQEFCGKLCHKVMYPEFTTYQHSAHARVKCAECHIGEGADWFVKAKISGLRQVYNAVLNRYPTPIVTPIANLRPAQETCEKCHWPQKFYTHKIRQEKYYLADSANTEWSTVLKMKIGASHSALGLSQGIHWHINPDIKMEYLADTKREFIPWVKMTNSKTGETFTYLWEDEEGKNISNDSLKKLSTRKVDCMDCHNRPSHEFRAPSYYINHLFAGNKLPAHIPWLKAASMGALKDIYPTLDTAKMEIQKRIVQFYKDEHPEVLSKYEKEINSAIKEIQYAYSINTFPKMKVSYMDYPRHIGHLETNGCFRCHDDKHKSREGKVISKDCNLCHTFIGQGKTSGLIFTDVSKTMEFIHPVDIEGEWKTSNCSECHFQLFQ